MTNSVPLNPESVKFPFNFLVFTPKQMAMVGQFLKTICATLVLILSPVAVMAQNVPSAVSILNAPAPASKAPVPEKEEEELNRGRYTKKVTTTRRTLAMPEKKASPSEEVTPNAEVAKPMEQATTLSASAPIPQSETQAPEEEAGVGEQIRNVVVGGSGEDLSRYRSYIAPDDIRRNRVELEVAPLFIYNESKSESWVRSYNTATPAGRLGLGVWFSPFFGVQTSYQKTFLGTVQKQFNSRSQSPFMDQWLRLGFRFRRFSSFSSQSPSLTVGLDYYDYQRKLPADDLFRNKIITSGLMASLEARIPSSEVTSWLLGLDYLLLPNHREQSLGAEIRSGDKAETFHAGISFGPEFKMARSNRLFLRNRIVYEKNSFIGFANTAEPATGQILENVSVANTFVLFEVGYIWGN